MRLLPELGLYRSYPKSGSELTETKLIRTWVSAYPIKKSRRGEQGGEWGFFEPKKNLSLCIKPVIINQLG